MLLELVSFWRGEIHLASYSGRFLQHASSGGPVIIGDPKVPLYHALFRIWALNSLTHRYRKQVCATTDEDDLFLRRSSYEHGSKWEAPIRMIGT